LVLYAFRAPFGIINIVYAIFSIFFVAYMSGRPLKRRGYFSYQFRERSIFILLCTFCGFLLSLLSGWSPRGDTSVHLQSINNLMADGIVSEARYSLVGHPVIPDQLFSSLHVLVALISTTFGVAPDVAWHYLSPLIAIFVPASVLLLLAPLTADKNLKLFTLTAFMVISFLFSLLMHGTVYDALILPNRFYVWIIVPAALYFLFRFYSSGQSVDFVGFGAATATFFTVHQEGFIWMNVFCVGAVALSCLMRWTPTRLPLRRTVSALILLEIVAVPFLIWKRESNALFIEKASVADWFGHYKIWILNDNIYAFNILERGAYAAPTIFFSIFVIVYLGMIWRSSAKTVNGTELFALATAISFMPLALIYNPLLFPVAMDVVSAVTMNRMLRIPLFHFAAGLFIFVLMAQLARGRDFSRYYAGICSLVLLGAFALAIDRLGAPTLHHETLWAKEIRNLLTHEDVVLADRLASSDVASMTFASVLNIRFNGVIDLLDQQAQRTAVSAFFKGDSKAARGIVEQYRVSYVVASSRQQIDAAKTYDFLVVVREFPERALFSVRK